MKVTWIPDNQYSGLKDFAEWQDKLAGPRFLCVAGIGFVVFWGVVFWLLGAWVKVARYF